jgi:hypothetical protein
VSVGSSESLGGGRIASFGVSTTMGAVLLLLLDEDEVVGLETEV